MKFIKPLLTLTVALMLNVVAYAEAPYKSLYYDGAEHPYTADKINLSIGGELLDDSLLPIQPINIDGARTLVPLREVFENLGASVNFYSDTNTVVIKDGNNVVTVKVGSTQGIINNQTVAMDVAPKYVALDNKSSKKVMIPLRFVGEGLGFDVGYNASERLVSVSKPEATKPEVVKPEGISLTDKSANEIKTVQNETAKISSVILPTSNFKAVKIVSDTPITGANYFTLSDGRLIIDIDNAISLINPINKEMNVDDLTNVRFSQFSNEPKNVARTVLAFNDDTSYAINLSNDRKELTVLFNDNGNVVAPTKPEQPTYPEDNTSGNSDKEKPTGENVNATEFQFRLENLADAFYIYGDYEAPGIFKITELDKSNIYIDINRPTNFFENEKENISRIANGNIVESYSAYNLDDDLVRIHAKLKGEYIYNVVKSDKLTKVYLKRKVDAQEKALEVIQDKNMVVLKISKDKAEIPNNFNISSIVHEDKYLVNQYNLTLGVSSKGKVNTPYTLPVNNALLKNITILSEGSNSKIVMNGNKVLHVAVSEDEASIIFTVKAARDVYDKIIVVDAGHGGTDGGTAGKLNGVTYYEKNVVIDMATKLKGYIEEDKRFKVYMTRKDDIFIKLYDRPAFSSALDADMFISIHANASEASAPNGIDTFYFDVQKENEQYLNSKGVYVTADRKETTAKSKEFAKKIQTKLISTTLLTDRGYKHADFAVLRQNDVPSVLIETGFMSNQRDLINLAQPEYRTKVARAIADVTLGFYNEY